MSAIINFFEKWYQIGMKDPADSSMGENIMFIAIAATMVLFILGIQFLLIIIAQKYFDSVYNPHSKPCGKKQEESHIVTRFIMNFIACLYLIWVPSGWDWKTKKDK